MKLGSEQHGFNDRSLQERKGKRGGKMFVRSSTGVGDEQYSKPWF